MAFSAQPDHGQNYRKERVLSGIGKAVPREKAKFVPNPAAKPFVPSSNFDKVTRSNKTWTATASIADRGQDSQTQVGVFQDNHLAGQLTVFTTAPTYRNGSVPNGLIKAPLILQHPATNGVNRDEPLTPTTPQPGKHIALHLLSKVLDDESIFNFTSLDESGTNLEPFSPVPADLSQGHGFDGTAHSWPIATNNSHPHTPPVVSIPGIATSFGSFPGQNIWSTETNPGNTPSLSPLEISPPSSCTESIGDTPSCFPRPLMRPNSLSEYERHSPMVNGYTDDQSPYPSPTGQSHGSSDASPRQSFLPIQEPYSNGRSQQSCESGYYSNSNNGSYYGAQMSPSSVLRYMPSPPELHTFILPLSGPGSQYSSPSMSPSSPPLSLVKTDHKQLSPDPDHTGNPKLQQQGFKDKSYAYPSTRDRRENGYVSYGIPQRKSPLTSELHMRLDKCYEQLRCLEKERKKAEAEISHLWSGRRLSNAGNSTNLRLPPNPSRVDKTVVDQFREHAKVEALVSRIERIRHSPLHVSISEGIDQWQQAMRELQCRRKEEISNGSNGGGRSRLCTNSRYQDGADLQALVLAVKELNLQTRITRTTVWCAVQLVTADTIPRPGSFAESDSSSVSASEVPPLEGTGEVS